MSDTPNRTGHEARLHPLFVAACGGDRRCYAALLSAISDIAQGYVRRKLSADGDDVVQEILISVHKGLHTYDVKRPCMPWLAAIMHYRLNDALRRRYRDQRMPKVAIEDVEAYLSAPVTESIDLDEHIVAAIAELPEGQQKVITGMYIKDMSVADVSKALGMSISAVKVTAHRAYKRLRDKLKEGGS